MKQYNFILDGVSLELAPAGWDQAGMKYIRNEFYWSISRISSLTVRFVLKAGGGGLEILDAYNTDGLKASMTLVVQERNPQTDDYVTFFSGILDFNPSRFNINYEDSVFEIGAIDGSKEQKFFTRDEIKVDVNSLTSLDGATMTNYGGPTDIGFLPVNVYLNAILAGLITDNFTLNNSTQQIYLDPVITINSNEIGDRISSTNPVYSNDTAFDQIVTINMSGSYSGTYSNDPDIHQRSTNMRLMVTVYNSGGTDIFNDRYQWEDLSESASPFSGSFTPAGAQATQWTVPPDGYIEVRLWFYRGPSPFPFNPDNDINITYTISTFDVFEKSPGQPETQVPCFFAHDAMSRIIQLLTSEDTPANILFAEPIGYVGNPNYVYPAPGQHGLLATTTGWNLRGYPDKPFNLSARDLFRTIDGMGFLGMSYDRPNDRFFIDYKTAFFDESYTMFDLGEVDDFVVSPYTEAYFNEVKFGYAEDVEYDELQGANAFNVPCSHFLDVPVKEAKDIKTVMNGDTLGAEISRRLPYSGFAQRDTKYDELNYIFDTDGSDVLQGLYVTGGFGGSDEYYNTKYTPRENLKRWAKYLNVPLWKNTNETTFVKTQKNVSIDINTEPELSGLTTSNLVSDPMYLPETYEFKAPLTRENVTILNANPHGIVLFSFRNVDYAGYVLEVNGEGYKKKALWKLIRATVVDKNYLFENGDNYNFEDNDNYDFE